MTGATQASLCISVEPAQASAERGQPAEWTVNAWTTGGDVPGALLRLQAVPADGGAPRFSFGCGSDDGTAACDLGTVDANSAARQLQVQLTVPVSASAVKTVSLTVTGSAPNLVKAATATATVSITAPSGVSAATGSSSPTPPFLVPTTGSALPVGNLPTITVPSPSLTLSPGGNAANLFPTLDPSLATSGAARASTRPVANTLALPEGASIGGAQIAGLAALALAVVVAITRLSVRRRPATPAEGKPGQPKDAAGQPEAKADKPEDKPGQPEDETAQPEDKTDKPEDKTEPTPPAAAPEGGNAEEEKK